MQMRSVSMLTVQRLPGYLHFLKSLSVDEMPNVSSTVIADALGLNDVQVRKDLAAVSSGGRPKVGYITAELIHDIELFLGYHNTNSAILVGVGNLGHALMSYAGFSEYGLHIVAGFDSNPAMIGCDVKGKPVYAMEELKDFCRREAIRMAILTVPADQAQMVCDRLLECGILAIWNFASAHLQVPKNVLVRHENMACSLALLSNHLAEALQSENENSDSSDSSDNM